MLFFLSEGILILLTKGELTFDLIPTVPLVSYPSTAILFSLFGLYIRIKWKEQAPLVLAATYASWEIIQLPSLFILNPHSIFNYVIMLPVWLSLICYAYLVIFPEINLNNYSTILLLFFYANNYAFGTIPSIEDVLSELVVFLFVSRSVKI